MLLPVRGKQVISNETKGGQPPFAFLAVILLKTDIQGSKTTSCQYPLDLLLRPDYQCRQFAAPHHAPNIDSCTTNAPCFVYDAT
jgi:hypothetical protein